jgi:hypothetical protein
MSSVFLVAVCFIASIVVLYHNIETLSRNLLLCFWVFLYVCGFWWGIYYVYTLPEPERTDIFRVGYIVLHIIWILGFLFLWKRRNR